MPVELLAWPLDCRPLRHGAVNGIAWAVAPSGARFAPSVAGYAQIPAGGHPWSTCTSYDDLPVDSVELTFGPYPARGEDRGLSMADCGGWIGFSTSGVHDYWSDQALAEAGLTRQPAPDPELESLTQALASRQDASGLRVWTLADVIAQAQHLAQQIGAARPTSNTVSSTSNCLTYKEDGQ